MSRLVAFAALALFVGCSSYRWGSGVPDEMRRVSVPTFRNESDVTELGNVMARQVLREFQREGTFRIASTDDAAIEIQGVVKSANANRSAMGYDRRTGLRNVTFDFPAAVEVSVVDRRAGKVLVANRIYKVSTTFTAHKDLVTAERDATGRLADELARRVVDDVLNLTWQ